MSKWITPKPPSIAELLLAKEDSIYDEQHEANYDDFSSQLSANVERSKILDGTIFMPGSLALGIEIGMRIMHARACREAKEVAKP